MSTPTHRSFVGIAKESSPGTSVANTAGIPVLGITPKDQVGKLHDEGWRGSMVTSYNVVGGRESSEFGFNGVVFPDTIGWMLAGIYGSVVTTTGSPQSHAITLKNSGDAQPTSYTLTDFSGVVARRFPGCKFSKLALKYDASGLLTYEAEAVGFSSSTASETTSTFSSETVSATWATGISIDGTTSSVVMDLSLNFSRPVTPLMTVANTVHPSSIWAGPLDVEGSMTVLFPNETEYLRYRNTSMQALLIEHQTGSSGNLRQLRHTMSKAEYEMAEIQRGNDWVECAIDFRALANTTDAGATGGHAPCKTQLKNLIVTDVYV